MVRRLLMHEVLLKGEPLRAALRVFNHGSDTELRLPTGAQAFKPALVRIPEDSLDAIYHDVSAPAEGLYFQWQPPVGSARGDRSMRPITLPAPLRKGGGVMWLLEVQGIVHLPPGVYKLIAETALTDADGNGLRVNSNAVTFEFRDVIEQPERLEMLRIRAMRAKSSRDWRMVEILTGQMLELYPTASLAYAVRADAGMWQGDKSTSARMYLRALELMRSGADRLLVDAQGKHTVAEMNDAAERMFDQMIR